MSDLESLLLDIKSNIVTLINMAAVKGHTCYVVMYKGLLFTAYFNAQGEAVSVDPSDKNSNFEQFLDMHGEAFEFTHVLSSETHHFIYVIPKDIKQWMRRNINTSLDSLYWCIHRHFTQVCGPLPDLFKDLATRKNLIVRHYIRNEDDTYTKGTYDKLMATPIGLGDLFIAPAERLS